MVLNVLVVRDPLMAADVVYIDSDFPNGRFTSWLAYYSGRDADVPTRQFIVPVVVG